MARHGQPNYLSLVAAYLVKRQDDKKKKNCEFFFFFSKLIIYLFLKKMYLSNYFVCTVVNKNLKKKYI